MNLSCEISQIIKGMRVQYEMSQEDFAFKCGMQPGHISKIERGTHKPNLDTINKIANAFEMSTVELLSISKFFLEKPVPDILSFKIASIAQGLSESEKRHLLKIAETFSNKTKENNNKSEMK